MASNGAQGSAEHSEGMSLDKDDETPTQPPPPATGGTPPPPATGGTPPPPATGGTPPPPATGGSAGQGATPDVSGGAQPTSSSFLRFITWAIVGAYLLVALACGFAAAIAKRDDGKVLGQDEGRLWAIAFGVGTVAIALLIIQLVGRSSGGNGIFRPIIGADGRFSTSLAQLGLWTIAAGTGLGFLLGRVMFESADLNVVLPGATWDEYLILLGGPFAAAVLAKGVVTYKLDAGTLQKSQPKNAAIKQIATNDQGSADLVDSQYLLFNVIALGYFVIKICADATLPTMPPTLLAMTSGTAALYVANKAAQRNAPTITSVSPTTVTPGVNVTVLGSNFDPAEVADTQRRITVSLSGVTESIYSTDTSDTSVRFQVPATAPAGKQTLKVTSTAGVDTEPHDLEVLSSDVVITGSDPGQLRPGTPVVLHGRNMRPDLEPRIDVAGILVPAGGKVEAAGTTLTFLVPADLPDPTAESVTVTVSFEGKTDVSRTLMVEKPRITSVWRADPPDKVFVAATGWHGPSDDGREPIVLVNGRPTAVGDGWRADRGAPLEAKIPEGVVAVEELRIAVIDDLGRRSGDYVMPRLP